MDSSIRRAGLALRRLDPRFYQTMVLGTLLTLGVVRLDFDIGWRQVAVTVATALATQVVASRLAGAPTSGLPSAFISSLSLCLLLRTSDLAWGAAAAVIAIGSKFVVRAAGKHVFNPTNLALVSLIATTPQVWVSPGQWGSPMLFAFLVGCLGTVVVTRAARADVTFGFLACYAAMLAARALWLGDPMSIPLHRLGNGALLLFAFFMISDPKTTPDSRAGRLIFAVLVAFAAYYVQNVLFRTNGPLWALAAASPLVPLIDRLLPGQRYTWPGQSRPSEGSTHEAMDFAAAHARPRAFVH